MAMTNQTKAMYLDLVAAKATQLAYDLRSNKLWPGDLDKGIGEILTNVEKASSPQADGGSEHG